MIDFYMELNFEKQSLTAYGGAPFTQGSLKKLAIQTVCFFSWGCYFKALV